jgi:glycerol-3-phosphate dehydrogenase (NAD(P)+)
LSILKDHPREHKDGFQREIGIIGAGAFGTALALALAPRMQTIHLYSDLVSVERAINHLHINPQFLPGVGLPPHCVGHHKLEKLSDCTALFLSVPAQGTRAVCGDLQKSPLSQKTSVIVCSKGIEISSGKFIGEVVASLLPNPVFILSGPSFAQEISRGLPTTVTLAGQNEEDILSLQSKIETATLRIETCLDPLGVQIGGALKNLLAVGAGFLLGAGLGEDARAVLVTRGFQEMQKIAQELGGKAETLLGMSGLGDLLLTCMSSTSRNTTFGLRVARGEIFTPLAQPFSGPLAEGALTATAWPKFKDRFPLLDTPLFTALYQALYTDRPMVDTLQALLFAA